MRPHFFEPLPSGEERAALSAQCFEAAGRYMSVDLEEHPESLATELIRFRPKSRRGPSR